MFIAVTLLAVRDTSVVAAINPTLGAHVGWPTYVGTVRGTVEDLPAAERARAVIFTGNCGEAGALARYGADLPLAYSAQKALYYLGPPPQRRDAVIVWTEGRIGAFTRCHVEATMDNGVGVDNEEQGSHVTQCHLSPGGWLPISPRLQHYDPKGSTRNDAPRRTLLAADADVGA